MNKNEKWMACAISVGAWLLVLDITIENAMPAWAAMISGSIMTVCCIYLPSIIMRYGKE